MIERLVLCMTDEKDIVMDPYMGTGSSLCAAVMKNRIGVGSDIHAEYVDEAKNRIESAISGDLNVKSISQDIHGKQN